MQTVKDQESRGLCCMEWQEWLVGVALPSVQEFADREFVSKPGHWFNANDYNAMCNATSHSYDSPKKKFLLSHDFDSRHSYKLHTVFQGKKCAVDRRTLPIGTRHAIPLHPQRSYVPLCPRVQDCIQSPIEMFFAPIKVQYLKVVGAKRREKLDTSPAVVYETGMQAFKDKGSVKAAYNCWEHARKSLIVWTTPTDKWVEIDGMSFKGTGGNWVHKELAG